MATHSLRRFAHTDGLKANARGRLPVLLNPHKPHRKAAVAEDAEHCEHQLSSAPPPSKSNSRFLPQYRFPGGTGGVYSFSSPSFGLVKAMKVHSLQISNPG